MRRQINAIGGLGNVLRKQNQFFDAIDQYQAQLSMAQSIGDPRSSALALFHIAMCHGLQGDVKRAIAIGEKTLQQFERLDDPTHEVVREALEKWKQTV